MALDWQTELHRYRRYFVNVGQLYRQKKVRVYTEIILSILTTAFFLFLAIKPTAVTITGLIKEIKDKELVAEKLEEKISSLSVAQNEYQNLQSELYLVGESLPNDSRVSLLVKQLEVLALKSQATIETVQFNQVNLKEKISEGKLQEIGFSLALTGDYPNLKNFLQSLGELRRLVLIESFAFKAGKKEEQPLVLTLNAKAFFLKE